MAFMLTGLTFMTRYANTLTDTLAGRGDRSYRAIADLFSPALGILVVPPAIASEN